MESTSACLLLEALFLAVCLFSPATYTRTTDGGILGADSFLQTRHMSRRDSSSDCVTDSCTGKRDGNYPSCSSNCNEGFYFTCSNGSIYKMQCPLDWYRYANGTRYTAPMIYLPEKDSCQLEANYCHKRGLRKSGAGGSGCVSKSCEGKPNGNYPSCSGNCKDGYFFTCSNGYIYKQQCPLGWYNSDDGSRYTAPMVYIPELDSCELEPHYCRGGVHPMPIYPVTDNIW